ncbi:hypothetical protein DFH08DRAFT_971639 [Mycena albidolilacea]|uniref:Enoyl reductase (ER) domain-containing protein n=1 Tax=Mycena albidolilacea TaxID=1033008 RepID=A0AAD6ZCS0_9AGAR|nr:hypothetical protein DFH08DRAFT_971639 [Mycena albidolilacea]
MAPIQNARVLFGSIPETFPIPGETTLYDTSQTIDLETEPLNGGFLVKTLVLSLDPFLRMRMRDPSVKSYLPPFKIGAPLDGYGVGIVLRSETAGVQVGKYVYGLTILHQEYTVYPELGTLQIIEPHPGLSLTAYVTAAGMPGQTAYAAWKEYSDAKPGEVAFVTSGAGAVGTIVIQLAKQAGLKVIASAGSEEKVKFMQSIGADVAFNYKNTDTGAVLEKEGPIDMYDNVGGDIVDVAIEASAHKARILACGSIAGLNTGHAGVKNFHQIVRKALRVHGILILDLLPKYQADFYATIPPKLASGELKYTEDVSKGLSTVGDVFLAVLKGTKKAKAVVVVADE